uniref:uncharacterized protein LOC117250826 n=1 Tax=Epinephelus lanceolatus TaxID=310571 RepID=UPI001446B3D8|nr:uncharacterized protein LOC117250826 [Epinephelus lanceolatus]
MLMSALYIVLDAQFDYSVNDIPVLRRWWCLLLLENYPLNSYGKVFAHWTKECEALLKGKHSPVYRLKRKREQNTEAAMSERSLANEQRQCMADLIKVCVFQTSENTGMRLLYPDVQSLEWVQCHTCKGWLHTDCARKCTQEDEPFDCGCTFVKEHPSIIEAVETGRILSVFSVDQIKSLYHDLMNGQVRSNRMYLWINPSTSWKLKQHLKPHMLHFSDQRFLELMKTIEQCTDIGERILKGENSLLYFTFDVFVPEIIIKILEGQGVPRYAAEQIMASVTKF